METRNDASPGSGYTPGSQTPADKASAVEDFIDIFASPAQVYARREKSGFGIQLLIVTALMGLFTFANRGVMSQIFDAMYSKRATEMMAKNPRITAEMMESQKGISETFGMIFGYVGTPVMILVLAILVWLFARIFSAKISYGQAALITTLAWIPRLIGSLLTTIQVALTDTSTVHNPYELSASPARFVDEAAVGSKVYALLGNLDVFSIWSTILIGIGIAVIAKAPRQRGYMAAAALFIVGTLLTVAFA
jgi:hypothetical protein